MWGFCASLLSPFSRGLIFDAMTTAQPKITIYTTPYCPYCHAAKALLKKKGAAFEEIDVQDPHLRQEMMLRSHGRRTVPQIFIGDAHVGGSDDIHELDRRGQLDPMLSPR